MAPIPQYDAMASEYPIEAPKSEETMYAEFLLHDIYIFYGIAMIAGFARIIVRCTIMRRVGLEEAIMLFLIVCYTGYIASVHLYLKYGTNLMVPAERFIMLLDLSKYHERVKGSKAMLASWFLYCTVIWGCKVCIWIVCKRLTDRTSTMKRAVKYTVFFLAFTYGAAVLTIMTICSPFPHYWQIEPEPARSCKDGYYTLLVIGSLNILSDIPLLIIPMPLVTKLQIGWRKKALLYILFGIGICAVAAAAGRIIEVSTNGLSGASTFWALTETTCAFVITNTPGIQSAFIYCAEQRKKRRATRRISNSFGMNPLGQNRDRDGNHPAERYRHCSNGSLVGSEDDIIQPDTEVAIDVETVTKTVTADLKLVTQPVECELTPEWNDEEDKDGVGISAYFPGIEEAHAM